MKHFKFKVCVLIILVVAFVSGAIWLIFGNTDGESLSDDDINAVVNLLESKNITIDKDIIPRKARYMAQATASSEFKTSEDLAKVLFEKDFVSYDGVCEKNGVTIRLTPEIFIRCDSPKLEREFKNTTKKNAAKKVKKVLEKYDINIDDSIIEVYDDQNELSVVVTQSYDGFNVFNNSLVFEISDKGISSVKGMYFGMNDSDKEKARVSSAADALIKFAMDSNNRGVHITGIEQGYRIDANQRNLDSTELIPTWSILTSEGNVYFINAS